MDASKENQQVEYTPPGRLGAFSFIYNGCFYIGGGYLFFIDKLDLTTGLWCSFENETKFIPSVDNHNLGSCCTVLIDKLYVFGGERRNADINELDMETLEWRQLPILNPDHGPLLKDKAAMFSYGQNMIGVFGGYGYPSSPLHAMNSHKWSTQHVDISNPMTYWTNELHLLQLDKSKLIHFYTVKYSATLILSLHIILLILLVMNLLTNYR